MISHIQGSLRPQTRRARRRAAILLIAVWAMFWLSQAYAACCDPHGRPRQSIESGAAMPSHAPAAQVDCNGGHEPTCPVMLDEALPLAGAQFGYLDDGGFPQHLAPSPEATLPMRTALERVGDRRLPDSPGPPDRAYLRFRRLLI